LIVAWDLYLLLTVFSSACIYYTTVIVFCQPEMLYIAAGPMAEKPEVLDAIGDQVGTL
jgi:hypothetical protein